MAYLLDPSAVLDFAFDWKPKTHNQPGAASDWLANGETITAFTVTAQTGVTVNSSTQADGLVTLWLGTGQLGTRPAVTCHITTSEGRQDSRSFSVNVTDR